MTATPVTDRIGPTPIAVVGIGCRFPGGHGPDELWATLCSGADEIREIPRTRFDVDAVHSAVPATPGKLISRFGGFIDDIDRFDSAAFGISPREADRMDPQQRILLETTWEAFEDAGMPLESLAGSRTGVFVGQVAGNYWELQSRRGLLDIYATTGSAARSVISGRLSYAFDLRGPSLSLDTACSSSLVALHLACQSLRSGESSLAVAAGANLVLLPEESITYSQAKMLAPDGRCKFGDAAGDGFVRSDGFAAVVLKPLAAAQADGDRLYSVIRGSAVDNDGQGSGSMMAPAQSGQEDMLRAAYADARLDPGTVRYVEAHGTGTVAGDPVEIRALAAVLDTPARTQPCLVGSVKTNIGHAEGAAGLAGFVKAALAIANRRIPPSRHCTVPNPAIPWADIPIAINVESVDLPDRDVVVGVSSFGISGTNAHIVLGEAPPQPVEPEAKTADDDLVLIPLSANDPTAVSDVAAAYLDLLSGDAPPPLAQVARAAARGRSHLTWRATVLASDTEGALEELTQVTASEVDEPVRVCFVFPGQGSQWTGMGQRLLATEPAFASALAECDAVVRAESGFSVLDLVRTAAEPTGIDVIQPLLWSMEVSLARLWQSWGIEPDICIGHSMGESAAAAVSGALSLADAAAVICRRSRLLRQISGQGVMAQVDLPRARVEQEIRSWAGQISVAVSNSPASTVLSGEPEAVAAATAHLATLEVPVRTIKVDVASHSPQTDPLLPELVRILEDIRPRTAAIPIHSTVVGRELTGAEMTPRYWADNLRETVRYADAVTAIASARPTVFVEISPHPLLVVPTEETLRAHDLPEQVLGSTRRYADERSSLLTSLGTLYRLGLDPDWSVVYPGATRYPVSVPTYRWQGRRHWLPEPSVDLDEIAATVASAVEGGSLPRHPISATPPHLAPPARVAPAPAVSTHPLLRTLHRQGVALIFDGDIENPALAFLDDHRVNGAVIMPGTAYLDLVWSAVDDLMERGEIARRPFAIRDVDYVRALYLGEPGIAVRLELESDGTDLVHALTTTTEGEPTPIVHGTGRVVLGEPAPAMRGGDLLREALARCASHDDGADFYARFARRGNSWAGAFAAIGSIRSRPGEAVATFDSPFVGRPDDFTFHPALLDACGQALAAALPIPNEPPSADWAFVLGGIDEVRLFAPPTPTMRSHAVIRPCARPDSVSGDITVIDADGRTLAVMKGLRLRFLDPGAVPADILGQIPEDGPEVQIRAEEEIRCTELTWQAAARAIASSAPDEIHLLLTEDPARAEAYAAQLRHEGSTCLVGGEGSVADLVQRGSGGRLHVVALHALDLVRGADAPTAPLAAEALIARLTTVVQETLRLDASRVRLTLVTAGTQSVVTDDVLTGALAASVWGFGRAVAQEQPGLATRLIDLSDTPDTDLPALIEELLNPDDEPEIALRAGRRYAARLTSTATAPLSSTPASPAASPPVRPETPVATTNAVGMSVPGFPEQLDLVPVTRPQPTGHEVEIEVTHSALNYRDVLMAYGLYPGQTGEPVLGWECAGTVTAVGARVHTIRPGDRVVAVANPAMRRHVLAHEGVVARIPEHVTSAEAVTLPVAALTAWVALVHHGRISEGDRVLVHQAAGGVGLAAVMIARAFGARVVATAGTPEKRSMLRFLGVEAVADSRSSTFVDATRDAFGDDGADIIVNTLSGDLLKANLQFIAPYGRIIELSKRDILEDAALSMRPFARNVSYVGLDIAAMVTERPDLAGRFLAEAMAALDEGRIHPLPAQIFPAGKACDAFRHMAGATHVGKIVLDFTGLPSEVGGSGHDRPTDVVMPVRADGTYLVTGGAGGLGRAVAERLLDDGAGRVVLMGRSPVDSAGVADALARLHGHGRVTYISADVADLDRLTALWPELDCPDKPLRGVVHAAGTIAYRPVSEIGPVDLAPVLAPKIRGAWNLDRLTVDARLDFFVLFSSASALLGSPLLCSYAAANAALDGLARRRLARGLPCTSVNWGFWSEAGMVAEMEAVQQRSMVPTGIRSFGTAEGLDAMARLVNSGAGPVAYLPADWSRWAATHPAAARTPLVADLIAPYAAVPVPHPPTPAPTPVADTDTNTNTNTNTNTDKITGTDEPTRPAPEREAATAPGAVVAAVAPAHGDLAGVLRRTIAEVLRLPATGVNTRKALNRQGLDSLMAVEVRNRIQQQTGLTIPVGRLLGGASITDLSAEFATTAVLATQLSEALPRSGKAAGATATIAGPEPVRTPEIHELPNARTTDAIVQTAEPASPPASDSPITPGPDLACVLRQTIAEVLRLPATGVNTRKALNRQGLDSLMAVEVRNRIQQQTGLTIPVGRLLGGASITDLSAEFAAMSGAA